MTLTVPERHGETARQTTKEIPVGAYCGCVHRH